MDINGEHPVARIDDTVTPANLHQRAEAVAVPDFNFLEQVVSAIAAGLTRRRSARAAAALPGAADPQAAADASRKPR
jgi:hypothetical protein